MRKLTRTQAPALTSPSTQNGASPLFMACQNGHLDILAFLLEHGGRPDTPVKVIAKHAPLAVLLPSNPTPPNRAVSSYPNPILDLPPQHEYGAVTPLMAAAWKDHSEIVG